MKGKTPACAAYSEELIYRTYTLYAYSDPVLEFMFEEDALEQFGGKLII